MRTIRRFNAKTSTYSVKGDCPKLGPSVPWETDQFFPRVFEPPIRSSNAEDLEVCPRKYLYKNRLGIHPKGYVSSLGVGTVVHKMLQVLFQGGSLQEAETVAWSLFAENTKEIEEQGGSEGLLPGGSPVATVLDDVAIDVHKAIAISHIFWKSHTSREKNWTILKDPQGNPMVETLLEVKLSRISVPLRAPCDLAVLVKNTNDVFIVDHKTTAYNASLRSQISSISFQMALYRAVLQTTLDSWAQEHDYPHHKVVGTIHNIIQIPRIKYCPHTKDSKGFQSYIDRVSAWYAEQERMGNPPIVESVARFSEPVWNEEFMMRLRQLAKAAHSSPSIERFYRTAGSGCIQYNKPCPYLKLCASSPALWPLIVKGEYEIKFREDSDVIDHCNKES